ncbi:MAG: 2OG-Fe dioxygenase family protein [Lysobacteraceae bacterium]
MLLERLDTPITVLNVGQYGVNVDAFQQQMREAYPEFEWDSYLLQQNKISLIKEILPRESLAHVSSDTWYDIYTGVIQNPELYTVFPDLTAHDRSRIEALVPTRKRCMSEYLMHWSGEWNIERIPSSLVSQTKALIASDGEIDYRQSQRKFKELPEELFDDNLRALLVGVAEMVRETRRSIRKLNVSVHNTVVYCHPQQLVTNSPEGIHQDGVEYIISALVVERNNISGGKSVIYGRDKRTKLLQVELQAGQGIFQADLGTELWHEVTPITAIDKTRSGYRSTIGFDVTLI